LDRVVALALLLPHLLELPLFDDRVLALMNLVPLDDLVVRNLDVLRAAEFLVADRRQVLAMELPERHPLRRLEHRMDADRDRDEPERDVARPDGAAGARPPVLRPVAVVLVAGAGPLLLLSA